MNRQTRRRNQQRAGASSFFNMPTPFASHSPSIAQPVLPEPTEDETFEESELRINEIINNVQTTRFELQEELEIYEKKLTMLEEEFTKYQQLALKVVAALKVIDEITKSLTEKEHEHDEKEALHNESSDGS